MANLTKQTVLLVGEEVTVGYAKASTADYSSTETSATLLARTEGTLATIVEDSSILYRFNGTADEAAVDLTLEDFNDTTRWINIGEAWVDEDGVLVRTSSRINMSIESLERDNLVGSLISCKPIAGTESNSGTIDAELAMLPIAGTEAGRLNPHLVLKNSLGYYAEKSANVTTGTDITEVTSGTGTHDLYRLNVLGESVPSLAIRQYEGGNINAVQDFGGVVAESTTFNLTAGQLLTTSTSVAGTLTFINTTAQPTPPSLSCGDANNVFVVKNVLFKLDGSIVKASDVTITITNTVEDRAKVNTTGIDEKIVTSKQVEVSFTRDLEDLLQLIKFKQNASATLFIELINGNRDSATLYLPDISRTAVEGSDDAGIIVQNLTFRANNDINGNALYIATKKA